MTSSRLLAGTHVLCEMKCWPLGKKNGQERVLHVDIHVSGGLILGSAKWRDKIFRQHMPLVLEAFRYGDREWIENHPELDQAPIKIHFHATHPNYDRVESWGILHDYK